MLAHMKTQTTGALTEISLTVPTASAEALCRAINSILELAQVSRPLNEDGEPLYTASEVFPESSPGNRLRGLRTREGITQKALAVALGIRQHHVSEMEKGTRRISVDMAKRIGQIYNISWKVFL
ncbi:helix-turn-helix domain-containing protein [Desulfosarcina sp. OttesenSCG-928-B08]|nr:helix-turn-helix domain-containing protein [Desulfosarcina sp. OttesenSCG-928-B08]